jgi:hypothetical protein
MLASTVQFSNNDQPPVTHHHSGAAPGPAVRGSFPQDPTACPAPGATRSCVPHPAGAVLAA